MGIRLRFVAIAAVLCQPILATGVCLGFTPFEAVPTVGSVSQWESPRQIEFLQRLDRLIAFRSEEVPLARGLTLYLRQGVEGSAAGGGGDGLTAETAFVVRHMADVRALLAPRLTSGVAVLFRRGDTFAADTSNAAQGLQRMTVGGWSLGSYSDPESPSERKPRLLGFRRVAPSSWTQIAPNVVELSGQTASTWWVRGRLAGSDEWYGYRAEPYVRETSMEAVVSTPRSFFASGGVVRVNLGSPEAMDELATLELACATGAGVLMADIDDVRIDGLVLEGWGLEVPEDGNGAIRTEVGGSNVLLVTDCEWGWTAYHGMLHAQNARAGGIVTLINCTFGYHANRVQAAGGGGDGAVSFNLHGGNEFIVSGCVGFGGGLRRVGVAGADRDIQGMPLYMHTGGTTPIALHVRRGCRFEPISATRCRYGAYGAANDAVVNLDGSIALVPADVTDVRYYRAFVLDETAVIQEAMNSGGWRAIDINCRVKLQMRGGGGVQQVFGVTVNRYCGFSINRDMELAMPSNLTGYVFGWETNVPHQHIIAQGRIRITGAGPGTPSDFFAFESQATRLAWASLWNCIISNETGKTGVQLRYPNQGATWNTTGGMMASAYFGIGAGQFSASGAPVQLGAAASFAAEEGGRVNIPNALSGQGSAIPAIGYDITRALRPAAPTIGPLEKNPVPPGVYDVDWHTLDGGGDMSTGGGFELEGTVGQPDVGTEMTGDGFSIVGGYWPLGALRGCAADINGDGSLDFFDYLDFVAAFSSDDAIADLNGDTEIDFFDYLDYVAAFSEGCD